MSELDLKFTKKYEKVYLNIFTLVINSTVIKLIPQ